MDVQSIFMQAPVPICIFRGKDYIIEFANDFYLQILDRGRDIVGKPMLDSFPELINQGIDTLFNTVMESGTPTYINKHEVHLIKKGKVQQHFFNCVYQPLREQKGEITGIIVVFTEVTEMVKAKKRLKENQEKLVTELGIANLELAFQNEEKGKRAAELDVANIELAFQNEEKGKRAAELDVANIELAFQKVEKGKRAAELGIANIELAFQNEEKGKRAAELGIANIELAFQNEEKGKRAAELGVANVELAFQKAEKGKRAAELGVANIELAFQDDEKEKRAEELIIANKELIFQNDEKEKRAADLVIANEVLVFQNNEKEKRAAELVIANKELVFQNDEKEKRAAELVIANKELVFQNDEKEKRASELFIANEELLFQTEEKQKRAAELVIADIELVFQNKEKEKREIDNIELKAAKTEAENAVKAKQQFLSNMSHEIRTPMNAIIGFTKVVLKTELSDKQKEYLNAIKMSGDSLIVLINNILDLAKVDAGKMTFEKTPFKLSLSISSMLHLFEMKIQEKNLQLIKIYDSTIPEVLVGDPVRLHQIILNLVSNAVKFTAQGNITVSVRMLSEDAEKVNIEFAVSDTGIGITEDKMLNIFDNFQQASSNTARLFGGTGLGLAIVKQLVEAQDGLITVKSTINEGSTFSFTLSFQKTNAAVESGSETMELDPHFKNIKVLVVEDMPLNQLLMKTLLDEFGFDRDMANNGRVAIEKLLEKDVFGHTKAYDIILMDLQMPEMNGFEATDYIRNTLKSSIPIIALTADVTTVDLAKCKAVGMNDYISKPIDDRILYNKIVSLVKKQGQISKNQKNQTGEIVKSRCTNLIYLNQITKSNPLLMMEMITAYLEQTPPLIGIMKQSFQNKDWILLQSAVHKILPSFSIMGMSKDFENMARKIMDNARANEDLESNMADYVLQLENICLQACEELEEEFITIKTPNHDE